MSDTSHKINRYVTHRGVRVPTLLYGTAWKEAQTETLTQQAITAGFRGIDTANQRMHYSEAGVGEGVQQSLTEMSLNRGDLFLQSKFTYVNSQDHRLPYDPKADYSTQVMQSFESSLAHLNTTYLDAYLLHGPSMSQGLSAADWEVWRTLQTLQKSGSVKLIGVSNVGFDQLKLLIDKAEIMPAFVQNRCFARTKWDVRIRELCHAHDIRYQGFSLLTANVTELSGPKVHEIAERLSCSVPQVVFRFALQLGMIPLTGTTSQRHMEEDLEIYDFELGETDMDTLENIAF